LGRRFAEDGDVYLVAAMRVSGRPGYAWRKFEERNFAAAADFAM
jgi:hypothetical protein